MMFKWSVMCLCFASVAVVRSAPAAAQSSSEEQGRAIVGANVFSDLRYAYDLYQGCADRDLLVCLKIKMLTSLDRVSRSAKDVTVLDTVKIVAADRKDEEETPVITEETVEKSLPRSLSAQDSTLNAMLLKKFVSMVSKYSVQVNFAEGRGKGDKKNGWVMIPVILAGSFVPLAYGALAFLAGKALIVSKLALVLASIIGIKKLVSSSAGHHEASHEVVVSGGHGGSGWGRTFDAQTVAYSAHAQN